MIKKILFLSILLFSAALFADTAYKNGLKAYKSKQYTPALKYFYVSARHHNINAYVELGAMHEYGIGTGTNPQTAFYWYEKAAQRNHPRAQYHLGNLYESGVGVKKDMKKATFWYQKAARNGNQKAKLRLANKPLKESTLTAEEDKGFLSSLFFQKENSSKDIQAEPTKESNKEEPLKTIENEDNESNESFIDKLKFWN